MLGRPGLPPLGKGFSRVENDEHLVDLTVDVKNQEGQSTAPGEATVALPSRNGD